MNQKLIDEKDVEPQAGQIYESSRNEEKFQILYIDEKVVLLRSDTPGRRKEHSHRMQSRVDFNQQLEIGFLEHQPNSDLDMVEFTEIDWSEVDYIGEKTSENLHSEGFKSNLDIQQADDRELLDVSGLGNAGLSNLREFSR